MNFKELKSCFIVAEISANHGQDFDCAVAMIKEAKKCGADAVKFQCYTPDILTLNCNNKYFTIKHPKWGNQTLYQLYKKAFTPWEWFKKLKKIADALGITFFSSAFDKTSVEFLESLNVPIHKIASFELVDYPLIEYAAMTKKPIILSAGMATLPELKQAVEVAKKAGAKEVILLKCVSSYPASPAEMNLRTIPDLKKRFGVTVGLSDHTLGIGVAVAAATLGAKIIEKHFTLSRKSGTPDCFFSIEPHELRSLVDNIRIAEKSLGEVYYGLTKEERKTRIFRRSLFIVENMKAGQSFNEKNVRSIRPGYGLPPRYYRHVIGKHASKNIARGTPLSPGLVCGGVPGSPAHNNKIVKL